MNVGDELPYPLIITSLSVALVFQSYLQKTETTIQSLDLTGIAQQTNEEALM